MQSTFARLVKRLVDRGRFTVLELCDRDLAECSERHFYNWLSGESHMPDYKIERISQYVSRHHETEPVSAFYSPEYILIRRSMGRANGHVRDDVVEAVKALCGIDESHEALSRIQYQHALERLRQKLADFEAEYDLLPPA